MGDSQVSSLDVSGDSVLQFFHESDEPSCTAKCRSTQHGAAICAIGTRGLDREVVSLWGRTCQNYGHVKDAFGRTAMHMAASYGKLKAVEWLFKHENSNIAAKDYVSGYTPLHRSIYFGQLHVARALISFGASQTISDNEGLCPLDISLKDRKKFINPLNNPEIPFDLYTDGHLTELFVWGTNDNYNLGTGSQSGRNFPEVLDEVKGFGNSPFSGKSRSISEVVMQNYHSVFLTQSGYIFTCGLGRGGRLATGSEETAVIRQLVPKFAESKCIQIAAGSDHTLFLMSNGKVYSCGMNENYVLGIQPPPEKLLVPKVIPSLIPLADPYHRFGLGRDRVMIQGIRCSSTHSVFFVANRLFTWGTNEGQLGHSLDYGLPVVLPKEVIYYVPQKEENECAHSLVQVECNDLSTVFRTKDKTFILYKNECRRIRMTGMNVVTQVGVVGGIRSIQFRENRSQPGKLGKEQETGSPLKGTDTPLSVIFLTELGRLLIWRENANGRQGHADKWNEGTMTRVIFSIGRMLSIKSFSVNSTSILLLTGDGMAFRSGWNTAAVPHLVPFAKDPAASGADADGTFQVTGKSRQSLASIDVLLAPLEQLKLRRIPNVFYGEAVSSDPRGNNFAIIQRHHKMYLDGYYPSDPRGCSSPPTTLIESRSSEPGFDSLGRLEDCANSNLNSDMEVLLNEAEVHDSIHDVEFTIGFNTFPAHRFIIASHCPTLYATVQECYKLNETLPAKVEIKSMDSFTFTQILQFIYSSTCDILERVKKNPQPPTTAESLKTLSVAARQLNMDELMYRLNKLEVVEDTFIRMRRGSTELTNWTYGFEQKSFEDLKDISLISLEGTEFRVHRCMLVARMDYFSSMFSAHFWTESNSSKLKLGLSTRTLTAVLDYVYEGRVVDIASSLFDLEGLIDLLRAADQFLLPGLLRKAEVQIADYTTAKNVVEIFRIASAFNASQLKNLCLGIMCVNVSMFLENRLFDPLLEEEMDEVTEHYRRNHPRINSYRVLTPEPNAPDHDIYDEASKMPNPEFDAFLAEGDFDLIQKKKGAKHYKVKSRARGFSETEIDPAAGEKGTELKTSAASLLENSASSKEDLRGWTKIEAPRRKTSLRKSVSEEEKQALAAPQGSKARSGSNKVSLESKKPVPRQLKTVGPIILPPKAEAMKEENEKMRELEVRFESALDFPCLGEVPMIPLSAEEMAELNQGYGFPFAKERNKKKTKWISVPVNGSVTPVAKKEKPDAPVDVTPPSNAWKLRPQKSPVAAKVVQLDDIIKEEKQKNENFQKAMQKPLACLQVEDRAVEEITELYTTEDTRDGQERLKVERVGSKIFANPTWVTPAKNSPGSSQQTTKGTKKGSSGR